MKLFFDTSTFIKRYVEESGSDAVESLCSAADDVAVSILLPIEVLATFARLKREKKLTSADYKRIKDELFNDLRDIIIISLTPAIVNNSVNAIEVSSLKALDAIHIGCALEYKPDLFISSDRQQMSAAHKMGLKVKMVP